MERLVNSIEKLCDEAEALFGCCYIKDKPNPSGGCEAAVRTRVRISLARFRECGKLLVGNRFPLKIKGKIYRFYVKSPILCGSETGA